MPPMLTAGKPRLATRRLVLRHQAWWTVFVYPVLCVDADTLMAALLPESAKQQQREARGSLRSTFWDRTWFHQRQLGLLAGAR